jgi:membrane protein
LIGASYMFYYLKVAIDMLWEILPRTGYSWLTYFKAQFFSTVLVIIAGLLLLSLMVISTLLLTLNQVINLLPPGFGDNLPRADGILMFASFFVVFTLIFRLLPDARLAWRDVTIGAFFTAVLFSLGEFIIGFFLSLTDPSSAYGAAGSVILIILWVYYSMQIILYGAAFTGIHARRNGAGILPLEPADSAKLPQIKTGQQN